MSLPTVLYLGPAALCALSWLGLGTLLLGRHRSGSLLLDVLTRFGVGAGTLSLLLFLIGRAGWFHPAVLEGVTAALAVPGVWALARLWRETPRRPASMPRIVVWVAGITALALVLDLVCASTPPTSVDALAYHVEVPHYWLGLGRINDPFWTFAAFYPLGVEMLFAQGLALAGGAAASAEHGILALLAALATYGLARELGRGRIAAGILGAALFVLEGTFTWDTTSTFIEMGFTFYAVLGVWLAVRYLDRPRVSTALLVGAAAGASAAAKNVGLLVVVFLLGPLMVHAVRMRRPWHAGAAAGGAIVLGAYWYIRDWIVTGNPVYPLLFGGKDFTPYFRGYLRGSATIYPGTHGANPLRILILPLDLLLHGERFDRGEYVGVGIFLFAAAAVWLLRRDRRAMTVAAGAAAYLVVWWYVIPQVRYLLPCLAVLAALAGAGLGRFLEQPGRARTVLAVAVALVVVDWVAPSAALERQLLPVAFGAESTAANVQRLVGTYDAMQAIARRVGPNAMVGFVGYRWPYWYPGKAIWVGWPAFTPDQPPAVLKARLRAEHLDYIVSWGPKPQSLLPIDCLHRLGWYPARYVTSRARGQSQPIRLYLFSARACYR